MVSLRNINAVIVFDADTKAAKFMSIGTMLRQHDADYIDGNTISVFDNNNLDPMVETQSRIIRIDARDGSVTTTFAGSPAVPFFTNIMGKHQILENGNTLITESRGGRTFEVTGDGRLVFGCELEQSCVLNESVTMGRLDHPEGFGPDGYYPFKFGPRIAAYGSRVFVANNRLPISRGFRSPAPASTRPGPVTASPAPAMGVWPRSSSISPETPSSSPTRARSH